MIMQCSCNDVHIIGMCSFSRNLIHMVFLLENVDIFMGIYDQSENLSFACIMGRMSYLYCIYVKQKNRLEKPVG